MISYLIISVIAFLISICVLTILVKRGWKPGYSDTDNAGQVVGYSLLIGVAWPMCILVTLTIGALFIVFGIPTYLVDAVIKDENIFEKIKKDYNSLLTSFKN